MIKSFSQVIKKIINKPSCIALSYILVIGSLSFSITGCSSYDNFRSITEDLEIPSQVYRADYNKVWQEVMKIANKFELELYNQEAGIVKTRWKDNTLELNFADSFGTTDSIKAARFKLIINVTKGFRGTKEVAKVTVFKRQQVETDFLQGWKIKRTDGIVEKSILYRLERSLAIEAKLQEIEDKKTKEAEKKF
jgi:hypothetical protein